MFCSNFRLAIFSLMFFPLFYTIHTDILKIYELPEINDEVPKCCQTVILTMIIYQANSMSQLHLAFELYSN